MTIDIWIFCIGISLFCVGFKITMEEGRPLFFLGKIYQRVSDELNIIDARNDQGFDLECSKIWYRTIITLYYVLTPIIGCVICFGSFWTCVWTAAFIGIENIYFPALIFTCFVVTFQNAIFDWIYRHTTR